jgi:hypothetical protein
MLQLVWKRREVLSALNWFRTGVGGAFEYDSDTKNTSSGGKKKLKQSRYRPAVAQRVPGS